MLLSVSSIHPRTSFALLLWCVAVVAQGRLTRESSELSQKKSRPMLVDEIWSQLLLQLLVRWVDGIRCCIELLCSGIIRPISNNIHFQTQTIVADYSQEYQWAQKTFRSLYIEDKAEEAQNIAFPTALLSGDLDEAIAKTLYKRGFTPENTIFAHSVCSDEVNNKDEQLVALMVNRWQEGFSLGGLAGLPFAGKSGK